MGDIVNLRGSPNPDNLTDNHEFIADLCRFAENILTEAQVKKKWRFDNDTWSRLGNDD